MGFVYFFSLAVNLDGVQKNDREHTPLFSHSGGEWNTCSADIGRRLIMKSPLGIELGAFTKKVDHYASINSFFLRNGINTT